MNTAREDVYDVDALKSAGHLPHGVCHRTNHMSYYGSICRLDVSRRTAFELILYDSNKLLSEDRTQNILSGPDGRVDNMLYIRRRRLRRRPLADRLPVPGAD